MGRKKTAREKKLERQTNTKTAVEARKKAERRKQELGGLTSGNTLQENSINGYLLQKHPSDDAQRAVNDPEHIGDDVVGGRAIAPESVGNAEVSDGLKGGGAIFHRLRALASSGGAEDAAKGDHFHSKGFKTNLSQNDRKEFVSVLQELEAIENPSVVERMVALLARMTADDPDYTAEELIEWIDNGDPMEVHDWRMTHETEYIIRENLLHNPSYRAEANHNPMIRRVADELGIDYTVPVTEKEEQDRLMAKAARRRELEEFPEILTEGKQHVKGRASVEKQ